MKLHLRIDSQNLCHTMFTVFVNGANAGTLVLRNDEYHVLVDWLLGINEGELTITGQDENAEAYRNLTE